MVNRQNGTQSIGSPTGNCFGTVIVSNIHQREGLQCNIRLFADDAILYTTVSSVQDCSKLQKDLDKVCQWASKWQMTFNPKKCNTMSVGLMKSKTSNDYAMIGQTLKQVQEHTYLGVKISNEIMEIQSSAYSLQSEQNFGPASKKYTPMQ